MKGRLYMKNIIKMILALACILTLVMALTSCEAFIDSLTKTVTQTTCDLFGHSIVLVGHKDATCTEMGYSADGICEICGFAESRGNPVAPLGHDWEDATCTAPKTCKVCGTTEGAPSHSWGEADANGTKACSACGIISVSNTDGLWAAIAGAEDEAIIVISEGVYDGVSFTNPANYTAKNLTLMGEGEVVLKGLTFNNWNPVESSLVIDGLTIKNITFDTSGLGLNTVSMSNVTVDGCKFINDACIKQGDKTEKLTNLVVNSCEFTGDGNGETTALMLENTENVTVTGCTFTSIDFNVLQMNTVNGKVLFDGNTVNGTGDRVFRFVEAGADVTISNNTILSDGDGAGELAKCSSEMQITLTNNVWNGMTDAEVLASGKLINITEK